MSLDRHREGATHSNASFVASRRETARAAVSAVLEYGVAGVVCGSGAVLFGVVTVAAGSLRRLALAIVAATVFSAVIHLLELRSAGRSVR
jgi:hypothetical protein